MTAAARGAPSISSALAPRWITTTSTIIIIIIIIIIIYNEAIDVLPRGTGGTNAVSTVSSPRGSSRADTATGLNDG